MNEQDIRKYAQLMQELGLTGLEITEDNKVVRLERGAPAAVREVVSAVSAAPAATAASTPAAPDDGSAAVTSPIVGVFYAAPAENADPYVSVGDQVRKGQILGIVEAMKLMNEICAEEDGTVTQICVANGQVVEYGTELFRIRR